MVGVGRNRGCFKPPLSSRPALWFLSCCRERNAPAASRKKSQIERFFCLKNVGIEQRRKSWKGKKHYPLSLTAFDSFARRRRQPSVSFADVSLSREYPVGEPRKATCLSLWERSYSPHRGNVCEADKRVWARYEPYKFRRNFRRGFTPSVSFADSSLKEGA